MKAQGSRLKAQGKSLEHRTSSLQPARSHVVRVGAFAIGRGQRFVVIAGPDVIEGERHAIAHAERMQAICDRVGVSYIYKSSYDKANRTSGEAFRGPGLKKGLAVLAKVKRAVGCPVLSDVHCRADAAAAAEVLDVIQVPAFLSRQTDFIRAVAKTGRCINIKKGQFLAPWDMEHAIAKAAATGNHNILVSERGASFGYNNLVSDMRSLPILQSFGYPVIYDGTHSVQLPGGQGSSSGGQRQFIMPLVRAAVATGACDGIFLEVHEDPDHAPCDGPNMLPLAQLEGLLRDVARIATIVRA